jgi:3'-phosphoadenosine 5'-phosphosulfate sulfotransferase (PAPS reductase)/FAD synthetase
VKKIIVPVSGGKDSQACLKLAVKEYGSEHVIGLFFDTKFEHPLTYDHIKHMKTLYNVEIITECAGSVEEKVLKYGRFPGGGARHCTDELKIKPGKVFYKKYAEEQGCTVGNSFEVWYGVRSDESVERNKRYSTKVSDELYEPNDFMKKYPKYLYRKYGIMFRLPVLDWTYKDVMDFLEGEENPLYRQGFDRVGCFPCLAAGDKWKEKAFSHDEHGKRHYEIVMELEDRIGKSIWTSKGGKERNKRECDSGSGCSLCSI